MIYLNVKSCPIMTFTAQTASYKKGVTWFSHNSVRFCSCGFSGKGDIFGENMLERKANDRSTVGKSSYTVRPLSHCDINKISTDDLRDILDDYPEFSRRFLNGFSVTFNLRNKVGYKHECWRSFTE